MEFSFSFCWWQDTMFPNLFARRHRRRRRWSLCRDSHGDSDCYSSNPSPTLFRLLLLLTSLPLLNHDTDAWFLFVFSIFFFLFYYSRSYCCSSFRSFACSFVCSPCLVFISSAKSTLLTSFLLLLFIIICRQSYSQRLDAGVHWPLCPHIWKIFSLSRTIRLAFENLCPLSQFRKVSISASLQSPSMTILPQEMDGVEVTWYKILLKPGLGISFFFQHKKYNFICTSDIVNTAVTNQWYPGGVCLFVCSHTYTRRYTSVEYLSCQVHSLVYYAQ